MKTEGENCIRGVKREFLNLTLTYIPAPTQPRRVAREESKFPLPSGFQTPKVTQWICRGRGKHQGWETHGHIRSVWMLALAPRAGEVFKLQCC